MKRIGLSLRVLLASLAFGLGLQALMVIPTLATYREQWLQDRLQTAQLASLAVEAARDGRVSAPLASELLQNAGVRSVALKRDGRRTLIVQAKDLTGLPHLVDLRDYGMGRSMLDTLRALAAGDDTTLRVVARPRYQAGEFIEIVVSARLLKADLWAYAKRLASTGVLLSVATAVLIYLTLSLLFVRPLLRLNDAMRLFRDDPEQSDHVLSPTQRRDEIGDAERELARLQTEVQNALGERRRLAALGTAVAKIAHDLRNILTTAQLSAERLSASSDPAVAAPAQRLTRAVDRAVRLAEATLSYGRAEEPPASPERTHLRTVLSEAAEDAGLTAAMLDMADIDAGLYIWADADQLRRVAMNLFKNARQAGASQIAARADTHADGVHLRLSDNGPGIPEALRVRLFDPFVGHGTGLGLAIARELMTLNGGSITLDEQAAGTAFVLILPIPAAATQT